MAGFEPSQRGHCGSQDGLAIYCPTNAPEIERESDMEETVRLECKIICHWTSLIPQQQRNLPWSQRALLSHHIGTSRANLDGATPSACFVNYVISDSVIKLSDRLCD
ncbi:hypothetical protein PoB_000635200 [Plakobranchus ocellatus]|uniref:Uncharacterized protein n=1 Tax=Plakobranchus ocellatus TaxID=259542 RepID=A0AAV3YAK2_9GAST|nr:hypothetical protein PoB_000635200 [Plakobranchus ocellatus]